MVSCVTKTASGSPQPVPITLKAFSSRTTGGTGPKQTHAYVENGHETEVVLVLFKCKTKQCKSKTDIRLMTSFPRQPGQDSTRKVKPT